MSVDITIVAAEDDYWSFINASSRSTRRGNIALILSAAISLLAMRKRRVSTGLGGVSSNSNFHLMRCFKSQSVRFASQLLVDERGRDSLPYSGLVCSRVTVKVRYSQRLKGVSRGRCER